MRKYDISVGSSRNSLKWAAQQMSFEELKEKLEKPVVLTLTQAQYKALGKADRDAAKDIGGLVGGKLKGTRRKKDEVISRSLIILDGDELNPSFIEEYELLHEFKSLFIISQGLCHGTNADPISTEIGIKLMKVELDLSMCWWW